MDFSRRGMLGVTGALIVGTAGAGQVLGAPQDIEITVYKEAEYIVLRNSGETEVDLSGYWVDFEHLEPDPQLYELGEGTVIEAGGNLTVATGYKNVPNADVNFGLDAAQLNNENPDEVALWTPDEETVVTTTAFNTSSPSPTATRTPTEEPTETPTEEPEETPTPTEEPEDTPTPTEEPEATLEPTEEPEDTPTPEEGGSGGGTASVTFDDQNSSGSSVVVQSVTLSDGGFLVVHDESGAVLGNSAYLESGPQSNVEVTLDDPITETQTLIAMAHTDDGDRSYEFPGPDRPYTARGGPVTDDARVTIC